MDVQIRNCRRKVRYTTEAKARIWGSHLAPPGAVLFPYQCPHCSGWHVTRSPHPDRAPITSTSSGIFA